MLYRASALWQSPIFLGNALRAAAVAINTSQARFGSTDTEVTIGNVTKTYTKPKTPQFVPHKYLPEKKSQKALQHLRWMLQKDLLGQDMFLIGRPGPERRRLAMEFLELTGREVEFVSLSRDTTEADLKQRRELRNGTAEFFDQSAVRAAVEGRILVLEGVEKAERNVLPVLNNLLENREMHLEDGRFLLPAGRYDKLLKENSQAELDRWRLVRVSEDFRVIALGLPVPRYPGNPLDPPLRSRFQARFVGTENFKVSSRPPSPSPPRSTPPPSSNWNSHHPTRLLTPPPPPPPPPPIALCDRVIQWLDLARKFPPPSSQPLPPVQTTGQFARPRVVTSAQRSPPSANTPQRRVMTARRSSSFGDTLPQRNRPAVIQVYRTAPPTVPLRAWMADTPRTKPQLHIFVPAVERKRCEDEAGESSVE